MTSSERGRHDPAERTFGVLARNNLERRLTSRVLLHWRDACGDRLMPRRDEIVPSAFADDWKSCFVLDLDEAHASGSVSNAVFAYVGDAFATLSGGGPEPTGRTLSKLGTSAGEALLAAAGRHAGFVLERRVPCSHGGDIRTEGRMFLYRSILLPLSDAVGNITALLGAANCRAVSFDALANPTGG